MSLMSHNIPVYDSLCDVLDTNRSAVVVMGTGVGKTYVTKEYVEKHGLRPLVLAPRRSICDSWKKAVSCDAMTYQGFHLAYPTIDWRKYDVLICDEMHHLGAKAWGEGVQFVIDNDIVRVIGLTDNPVRYTDGCRDMSEELFGGRVCRGESVPSAIEKGILNPVTYVGALFSTDGLRNYQGKVPDRLYAKLDLARNNTPTTKDILLREMPAGKRKGIIFAQTIGEMEDAMDVVRSAYPGAEMHVVHSRLPESERDAAIGWFNSTDEGYLCNVNMLVEGVHVSGVNTVIMLRRTMSPNVFTQQIGRCLSASSKERSVVFDLVGNSNTLEKSSGKSVRFPSLTHGLIAMKSSEQFIIKDYTKEISDVLEEINKELDDKWTPEEDDIMRKFYPEERGDIAKRLKNRTYQAIVARAIKLGIGVKADRWSDEDNEKLSKYYMEEGTQCYKHFPDRNKRSCIAHAMKLGLKKGRVNAWTDEEVKILKKYYPKEGKKVFSRIPRHTGMNCKQKAEIMGIKGPIRMNKWTDEEVDIIKKYYPVQGISSVMEMIPYRTRRCIEQKILLLGIRSQKKLPPKWTDEEKKILAENYGKMGPKVRDLLPGRSDSSIRKYAKKHGIK